MHIGSDYHSQNQLVLTLAPTLPTNITVTLSQQKMVTFIENVNTTRTATVGLRRTNSMVESRSLSYA
jgi:hypothetical protein